MFGRMMVSPVVQVDPGFDLPGAVAALIKVAENVEIVRWIELPSSVLLFLLVPGDPRFYKCWAGCSREMIRAALGCPIRVRHSA